MGKLAINKAVVGVNEVNSETAEELLNEAAPIMGREATVEAGGLNPAAEAQAAMQLNQKTERL